MIANLFVVVIASIALLGNGYLFRTNYRLHGFIARPTTVSMAEEMDPNFEEHLPGMMRAGSQERPSYDLASELRQKYKRIQEKKRQAATSLKTINPELAIELEDIADELEETHEKFVQASLQWDSWNRPPPDLPQQLRAEKEQEKMMEDPNFSAHLPGLMMAGSAERPDYELPQELREKYKRMAEVKRMAANEIRKGEIGEALAEELDDMADELEEAHKRFEALANARVTQQSPETSKSNR